MLPKDVCNILKLNNILVILTGIKYGTVTAYHKEQKFNITTIREETISFCNDFQKDAQRRDFTINAMCYDPLNKILYNDLQNKKVIFVGDPNTRIKEDYLRILRFFRFSAKYDYSFNEDTLLACIQNKSMIKLLSCERITCELNKILLFGNINVLQVMHNKGFLQEISKDFAWDILSYVNL